MSGRERKGNGDKNKIQELAREEGIFSGSNVNLGKEIHRTGKHYIGEVMWIEGKITNANHKKWNKRVGEKTCQAQGIRLRIYEELRNLNQMS